MRMAKKLKFPSTFEFALWLSLLVILAALLFTKPSDQGYTNYSFQIFGFWKKGFWSLLEFTLQMILILVLGHALAISVFVDQAITRMAQRIQNNTQAVLTTGMAALVGGYLNWGFGLVLGAVLARKIGDHARTNNIPINYNLVGASGYLGMLVWHGGLSGSAPLKVAETNHFLVDKMGSISIDNTIFSTLNIGVNLILVIGLFGMMYYLSKIPSYNTPELKSLKAVGEEAKGFLGLALGLFFLVITIYEIIIAADKWSLVDLNFINFLLLAMGLIAYKSLKAYMKGVSIALAGASDILIQFPFYAGILGIIRHSGLMDMFVTQMASVGNSGFFPLLTFLSAAFVNFFVPSGGGQWAIQGPVMIEATKAMGFSTEKMVMVFAYGDQLTNMLQPFWALPLLAITGISPFKLLQYTFRYFLLALFVFAIAVYFFV
jgi:short-chain fatty acids transporter